MLEKIELWNFWKDREFFNLIASKIESDDFGKRFILQVEFRCDDSLSVADDRLFLAVASAVRVTRLVFISVF